MKAVEKCSTWNKVRGMKQKRIGEWLEVVREEGRTVGYFSVGWSMLRGVWGVGGVGRAEWWHRVFRCQRCPLYDRGMRRCRPWSGSKLGCGCYVPFLALSRRPYAGGCWGRTYLPRGEGIGWE